MLEWVVISFSRGSSRAGDQTRGSCVAGGFFTIEPPGKPVTGYAATKDWSIFRASGPIFKTSRFQYILLNPHIYGLST